MKQKKKLIISVAVVLVLVVLVVGPVLAAMIWSEWGTGAKVVRMDRLYDTDNSFNTVQGYDYHPGLGGADTTWSKICQPSPGKQARVHARVTQTAQGSTYVHVFCIEAYMTPTPAPTEDPRG